MASVDKLGNYIERLDRPNIDLRYGIDDVCGITNTKQLVRGTKANLIGRTFEKFTILAPREFIFNRRTSRNGERISLGYNQTGREWILTEDYCHFRVRKDKEDALDPDFLYLFFLNPEFDRYARFNSWGSATEFFNWEEMAEVPVPILPIEEQKRIVREYHAISERSMILRMIFDNLENQLITVYHNLFDDHSNTMDGKISDFGEIVSGATPSTENPLFFTNEGIIWLSPKDLTSTGLKFIHRGEICITKDAYNSCSTKLMPAGTVLFTSRAPVGAVAIATNECCTNQGFKSIIPNNDIGTAYVYYYLKENRQVFENQASGTTFMEISGNVLKEIPAIVPKKEIVHAFSNRCDPVFRMQQAIEREMTELSRLQSRIIGGFSIQ